MKKTAIQTAIIQLQNILDYRGATENSCDDYEFGLIQSIKQLKELLPKEMQDINTAYESGYFMCNQHDDYFKETFEHE